MRALIVVAALCGVLVRTAFADPTYAPGDVFIAKAVVLDQNNQVFAVAPPGVSLRWFTSNAAVAIISSLPPIGEVVEVRAINNGTAIVRCRLDVGDVSRVGGASLTVSSGPTPGPGRTPASVSVVLEPAPPTPTPQQHGRWFDRWAEPRIYFVRW